MPECEKMTHTHVIERWDAHGAGEQTRYFMETLLSHLPEYERAYLHGAPRMILDWGCASGEGVTTLARVFPRSQVVGLDFSGTVIDQARIRHAGHEFIWSEDGAIPRDFDVIVTSNRLEHFEAPLAVLEKHLASCKSLYIALVPYNECPLQPQHRAQFRLESFPVYIRDFTRIYAEPLVTNERFWPGQQLLIVYGSDRYLREAVHRVDSTALVIARLEAMLGLERLKAQAAEAARNTDRQRAEAAEAERKAERQRADAAEDELRFYRDRVEALDSELREAEQLRVRISKGLREFQSQFEKQLSLYRSQRAWRTMLAMRKAYTVLVRRSFPGGLASDLDKFELTFPNVQDHVPQDLHTPIRSGTEIQMAPPAVERYDVIILPIFDFEFRFQRPQQIAAQFARAGHRVFWISPSRLLPVSSRELYESVPIRENMWEVRLRAAPFDLYRGALDPSQIAAMLEGLSLLYKDLGLASSFALLQFPFWRRIGLGLREQFDAKLVYDCMDDWQNWPAEPLPGAFSLAEERELVRESDVLVVTSKELQNRHAADHVESKLIPNAADFEFFRDAPVNSALSGISRPVVGYYGAIADWFDLDLILLVARSRPQYSFVLIGQVHLLDVSELKALPNTYLLGEKPYTELPGYLKDFDVCTLPFRMNRLTKAVDPVKVYEYLSQGKPVVSAKLPELEPLSELLYFAEGPEEFCSQIDRALAERDTVLERKRIAFASENTWEDRFDTLDRAIRATYPLVSILVVTYNTREYLAPFLDSIRHNTSYPNYEVIFVDNCSNDGSAEELNLFAARDPRILVECLKENLGFAGGNNLAANLAQGEYLVLLNPDTIVTAGWLEKLLGALKKDPAIGVVAPVSNFSGNETKVNTYYRSLHQMERFAADRGRDRKGESIDIETVPLFCSLIRRKLWEEVGALDEGFQIGTFEDDDFSLRVRNAGYRIVTAEDCFIHHFGNGSFGKLKSEESRRIFEQNKKRFESKWNIIWLGHKTRAGVRPVTEESKIPLSEFFEEEGAGGL
jgi:GT2 family glycosyltransferase/glycosyltransferase involved in cell wall biosynthesis